MRVRCALRLPGRPLVWLALALCALSCAYSLYRMENLPTRERAGRLTGTVAEVDAGEARLLVRGAAFSDGAGEERLPGNVLLDVETPYAYPLEAGSRICQFRIVRNQPPISFEVCEHLDGPSRGGFGSTGR